MKRQYLLAILLAQLFVFGLMTAKTLSSDITDRGTLGGPELSTKSPTSPPKVKYTYVDLGSELENQLGREAQISRAKAINNLGQVVGYVRTNYVWSLQAFWWSNGEAILLPHLPGDPAVFESIASSINDRGQIVGSSAIGAAYLNKVNHGVLWTPSSASSFNLTDLGAQFFPSCINSKGTILGGSFVYDGKKMYQLEGLPVRATDTTAINTWAINKHELIVGASNAVIDGIYVFDAACLWKNGKPTYLGALGGKSGLAYAINDKDQVVGSAETATGNGQAFLWHKGVMHNLQSSNPGSSSAYGINNLGQVVGSYGYGATYFPFLWTENTGMQNLQELVVDLPPEVLGLGPIAINDQSQIIGSATNIYTDNSRAFLLTPLPVDNRRRHEDEEIIQRRR
jgi:probable HAF family extracellular repeat protein